ncbi:MAG: hypothetical protein ACE5KW_05440, partial [Dehalococcoidia bacterium]
MLDHLLRACSFLSRPQFRREVARSLAHRGHHIAIVVTLVPAAFVTLSFPFIDGDNQPSQEQPTSPVIVAVDGLTYAIDMDSEAETVLDALTEAGVTIGPKDSILRNGVPVDP